MKTVKGSCPACGRSSLFLADGGYVSCSSRECPNPTVITDLLDGETQHIVVLEETAFHVQHPLIERADSLLNCGLHARIAALDGPPRRPGKYRVWVDPFDGTWTWQVVA